MVGIKYQRRKKKAQNTEVTQGWSLLGVFVGFESVCLEIELEISSVCLEIGLEIS
uniref:Uncharacterized protein n=1 Tax=Arundo donax TaxID=35708 RepID=A0A0A9F5P3_ARUDO